MALNNFKCNHLMPLHFKGLTRARLFVSARDICVFFGNLFIVVSSVVTVNCLEIRL